MRIYAVADIHGKPSRIERIGKNVSQYKPDAVVVAGDITNLKRSRTVIGQLNSLNLPVLAVRGNTDLPGVDNLLNYFSNTVRLHLKEYIIDGLQFIGAGGTIPFPFRSQVCFFENRVLKKISGLIHQRSIVVAHPPPWGILDEAFNRFHAGSKGLDRFIRRYQPRLFICGHIHEKAGTATIGNSVVVNCNMSRKKSGTAEWQYGRHCLTADVNAVIQGAFDGGAKKVTVKDTHDSGFNCIVKNLDKRVKYIGGHFTRPTLFGTVSDYNLVLYVAIHAASGTPDAFFPKKYYAVRGLMPEKNDL